MFWHKEKKRSIFLPFVIFRLLLSLTIFMLLFGGLYSAFIHFSGVDPLKLSPQAAVKLILESNNPQQKIIELISANVKGINIPAPTSQIRGPAADTRQNKQPLFTYLLIADSHNENNYLIKALTQAKARSDIQFMIGLGDYTEVGTLSELQNVKKELDQFGVRYFLAAGDHDLWDGRDKDDDPLGNYMAVFGRPYQSFKYQNTYFLIIYNSDNYLGVNDDQLFWLQDELNRARNDSSINTIVVFLHEPLYHPSSDRVMGKSDNKIKEQASKLTKILQSSGVKEVFAGDIHYFTRYQEPETGLKMTTIGAIASNRNTQAPRFSVVTVYGDGDYDVEDIEIKK